MTTIPTIRLIELEPVRFGYEVHRDLYTACRNWVWQDEGDSLLQISYWFDREEGIWGAVAHLVGNHHVSGYSTLEGALAGLSMELSGVGVQVSIRIKGDTLGTSLQSELDVDTAWGAYRKANIAKGYAVAKYENWYENASAEEREAHGTAKWATMRLAEYADENAWEAYIKALNAREGMEGLPMPVLTPDKAYRVGDFRAEKISEVANPNAIVGKFHFFIVQKRTEPEHFYNFVVLEKTTEGFIVRTNFVGRWDSVCRHASEYYSEYIVLGVNNEDIVEVSADDVPAFGYNINVRNEIEDLDFPLEPIATLDGWGDGLYIYRVTKSDNWGGMSDTFGVYMVNGHGFCDLDVAHQSWEEIKALIARDALWSHHVRLV
jgi:hypothetical protein